jgi:hypothetical protein
MNGALIRAPFHVDRAALFLNRRVRATPLRGVRRD